MADNKNIAFSEIVKHYPYLMEPFNLDNQHQYREFRYVANQKFINAVRNNKHIEMIVPAREMLPKPIATYYLYSNDEPCRCSKLINHTSEIHYRCIKIVNEADIINVNCARKPVHKTSNFDNDYERYEHFVAEYHPWYDSYMSAQIEHIKQIDLPAWHFYCTYKKLSPETKLRFVANAAKDLGMTVNA
jgi:hypothetical protein